MREWPAGGTVSCPCDLQRNLHGEDRCGRGSTYPKDSFYNNYVQNCYQCRLDSIYNPNDILPKDRADSDDYSAFWQEITRYTDACALYNMPPFVATTTLTEPPL